jgi:hypothetical protein
MVVKALVEEGQKIVTVPSRKPVSLTAEDTAWVISFISPFPLVCNSIAFVVTVIFYSY